MSNELILVPQDGATGATGATGPAGPNTVTTSTTTNITGLIEGNGSTVISRAIGVGASTSIPTRADADGRYQPIDSDLTAIAALTTTSFGRALLELANAAALRSSAGVGTMSTRSTYQVQVALSPNGGNISAGTKKGLFRVPIAGTVTGFAVVCDPANEPSASSVQVDLNTINLTTGVATSILSSVATIATGANVSTGGAISGSPAVAVGDLLTLDIDQGTDGRELVATITITAT